MKSTIENMKRVLEELGLKTIHTDEKSEGNILLISGLRFTKTQLQMLHISDVEKGSVNLIFTSINRIDSNIEYEDIVYNKLLKVINKVNTILKHGNFMLKLNDEDNPNNINLEFRLTLLHDQEISGELYKKAMYIALKTISKHAPEILDN